MTSAQMKKEMAYHASLAPFKKMLSEGMISSDDYSVIETILYRKYLPIFVENIPQIEVDIVPRQS